MALPRKLPGAGAGPQSSSISLTAGPLSSLPQLWQFLTSTCYEDSSPRKTGRISLSVSGGRLALSLNDDETSQYAFLEGDGVDDLLLMAEQLLEEDRMPWRTSKWSGKGKK